VIGKLVKNIYPSEKALLKNY